MDKRGLHPSRTKILNAILAAWLVYLALDFLTHAVFLAAWWRATESYWLPPGILFTRIPFAYLSFGIYAAVLTSLMIKLIGPRLTILQGLWFGFLTGSIFGGISILSMYSVFPMPIGAFAVWPVSAAVDSAAAGAAAVYLLGASASWRRLIHIFVFTLVLLVVGVILQNQLFPMT